MPPLITLIIAALAGEFGAVVAALTGTLLSLGASLVLSSISKLFAKSGNASSLTSTLSSRTVTVRQPAAPWQVAYGQNRMGGILTFMHTTGTNNELLHMVITLTGHEVNAIPTMYFDGVAVPLSGGDATGNFAGFAHAEFNLGGREQAAFPGLIGIGGWDAAHRQRGHAGVYVRLKWDATKFPNGVPNITFAINGRKVYDPRNGTIAYSNNAALCIADYLNNASFGMAAQTKYPVTAAMWSNGGFNNFNAANMGDNDTTTKAFDTNSALANTYIKIDLGAGNAQEFRRLRLFFDAAGFGTTIYVDYSDDNFVSAHVAADNWAPDSKGWNEVELAPNGAHRYWAIFIHTAPGAGPNCMEVQWWISDVDSVQLIAAANTSDEAVALTAGGNENRFTCDGSFGTDAIPSDILSRMLSTMVGSVSYIGGLWGIYPAIWRAPTISLSDADLRGPMKVQTRMTHRDLFNGVMGTFISPTNNWQVSAYPPYQDPTYLAEDNNEPIWKTVEFPFTISAATVQRLSKIELFRARRQTVVTAGFKISAYQVQPMDIVQFSHPRFGWVNKTFEVKSTSLIYAPDAHGSALAVGVDVVMQEADSSIYNWAGDITVSAPPSTTMPDNRVCQPPTGLALASIETVRATDGVAVAGILVNWTAPADQFVQSGGHIHVQWKKTSDTLWHSEPKLPGNITEHPIFPVIDGISYDVQMWAQNASGVNSTVLTASITPSATNNLPIIYDNLVKNGDFTQGYLNWDDTWDTNRGSMNSGSTSLPRGGTYFRSGALANVGLRSKEYIPVDPAKTYLIECWVDIPTAAGGINYGGLECYDGNYVLLGTPHVYSLFNGITGNSLYTYHTNELTGENNNNSSAFPVGTRFVRLYFIFNYTGTVTPVNSILVGVRFSEVAAGANYPGSPYGRVPQMIASAVAVENGNFEASTVILPPPGWTLYNRTDQTVSYDTSTPYSGLQSIKIVTVGGSSGLISLRNYACRPSDVFRISCRAKAAAGAANAILALTFRDKNGTALAGANASTGAIAWTFIQASCIAPASTVYFTIEVFGDAGSSTVEFDEIHIARMMTAFEVTPINTSGAPTTAGTTLVTQSGATKTINVASSTMQFGDGQVSYNSGSVTPATFGTWFIYADDPGFNGGAVTYVASANESDVYAGNGRIFFGSITTTAPGSQVGGPAAGAGGGRFRFCFSGNVRIQTVDGWKRFDELPERFEILNCTGRHWATATIAENADDMLDMGSGELVTLNHRVYDVTASKGEEWVPARRRFPDAPLVPGGVPRTVYNLSVESDREEDRHFLLENGVIAHNVSIS
jgi:hypothetical protein